MSYAPVSSNVRALLEDLAGRKEFQSTRDLADAGVRGFIPGDGPLRASGLRLIGAQQFIRAFNNPATPYSRVLVKWQTGTGKSIAAIAMAAEYIRVFRQVARTSGGAVVPRVFVISFTARETIQEDMLRHPELGFVSAAEAEELRRARAAAAAAGPASTEARHLAGYLGGLRRRITDIARGGYYQFYGYKEFAARLFGATPAGIAAGFDVGDLSGGDASFGERLAAAARAGLVRVNSELLEEMRGGFLIADEIHETYNITSENNYGLAIQYALDALGDAAPRAVFISATPMMGSAAEIVDLLNLLVPRAELPGGAALRRADFFSRAAVRGAESRELGARVDYGDEPEREPALFGLSADLRGARSREAAIDEVADADEGFVVSQMLPGALDRIRALAAGRVSFLLDSDVGAYPRRVFEGDAVPGVPYLKLTLCPMPPLLERSLAAAGDVASGAAYALNDMVFPNPGATAVGGPNPGATVVGGPNPGAANPGATEDVGLYLSGDVVARLSAASEDWRRAAGVHILRGAEADLPTGIASIGGDFLALPALETYSSKYARAIRDVLEAVRAGPGKILVFHPRVRLSGVLVIAAALRANGFADATSPPTDATICAVCGVRRAGHGVNHDYTPARFTVAHSLIDRVEMTRNIAQYNAPANADGSLLRVLVGSKIIRQSLNFRAVRLELILSMPTDYPTLLQIFGRVARRDSHAELARADRDVRIRIYVSSRADGRPTPELRRYAEKGREYAENIQRVDRVLHECAVDGFANWGRIRAALGWQDGASDSLDALAYEPVVAAPAARAQVATFEAYGYGDREVTACMAACAALFRARPVWTYADLRKVVTAVDEGNFALAVERLVRAGDIALAGDYYVAAPADVESYLGAATPARAAVAVDLAAFATEMSGPNFAIRLRDYERRYLGAGAGAGPEMSLVEVGAPFQYELCRRLVAAEGEPVTSDDAAVVAAYLRFGVLVTAAAAGKVRSVAGRFKARRGAPAGYVTADAVAILGTDGAWFNASLGDFGIARRADENKIVVGFVVSEGAETKFKIRPSIAKITSSRREGRALDIRTLARGAVCETRPRAELERYVAALGAEMRRAGQVGDEDDHESAASLCVTLRARLLALEAASRAEGGIRWLYIFNERAPSVAALR
jgi:hypothetical protein